MESSEKNANMRAAGDEASAAGRMERSSSVLLRIRAPDAVSMLPLMQEQERCHHDIQEAVRLLSALAQPDILEINSLFLTRALTFARGVNVTDTAVLEGARSKLDACHVARGVVERLEVLMQSSASTMDVERLEAALNRARRACFHNADAAITRWCGKSAELKRRLAAAEDALNRAILAQQAGATTLDDDDAADEAHSSHKDLKGLLGRSLMRVSATALLFIDTHHLASMLERARASGLSGDAMGSAEKTLTEACRAQRAYYAPCPTLCRTHVPSYTRSHNT